MRNKYQVIANLQAGSLTKKAILVLLFIFCARFLWNPKWDKLITPE